MLTKYCWLTPNLHVLSEKNDIDPPSGPGSLLAGNGWSLHNSLFLFLSCFISNIFDDTPPYWTLWLIKEQFCVLDASSCSRAYLCVLRTLASCNHPSSEYIVDIFDCHTTCKKEKKIVQIILGALYIQAI